MESLATPLVQFILTATIGSAVWLLALMSLDRYRALRAGLLPQAAVAATPVAETSVRRRATVTSIETARRLPKAA